MYKARIGVRVFDDMGRQRVRISDRSEDAGYDFCARAIVHVYASRIAQELVRKYQAALSKSLKLRRLLPTAQPNGLRFSRVARTRDRSTYVDWAAGYVGCKRELGAEPIHAHLE
jgi:hypothetical protein